jgi:hypothetical protein
MEIGKPPHFGRCWPTQSWMIAQGGPGGLESLFGNPASSLSRALLGQRIGHPAGHSKDRVDFFAPQGADDLLAEFSQADALLASSGAASMTPTTLRLAGSESQPNSRSGLARWKKCRAWD